MFKRFFDVTSFIYFVIIVTVGVILGIAYLALAED
jgi:hypothetical protein